MCRGSRGVTWPRCEANSHLQPQSSSCQISSGPLSSRLEIFSSGQPCKPCNKSPSTTIPGYHSIRKALNVEYPKDPTTLSTPTPREPSIKDPQDRSMGRVTADSASFVLHLNHPEKCARRHTSPGQRYQKMEKKKDALISRSFPPIHAPVTIRDG